VRARAQCCFGIHFILLPQLKQGGNSTAQQLKSSVERVENTSVADGKNSLYTIHYLLANNHNQWLFLLAVSGTACK